MTENNSDGKSRDGGSVASVYTGGKLLGTLYEQKFYAIRAGVDGLRFPFEPGSFTALVDIRSNVGSAVLESYARDLINHGCVQAVCRGAEAGIMNDVFCDLAEDGAVDANGVAFTSMPIDDEPLQETLEYFVLPSGLASTGLLIVIGEAGDFQEAVGCFADLAGSLEKPLSETVCVEDELVCFEMAK